MAFWTERVVPRITDRALASPEVMELRSAACAGLAGRVLEIGFGSGLNCGAYPAEVTQVDAVEPSELGWSLSARRRAGSPVPVERTGLDGQRLAAADAQYDAVLSTFTLCTIPDVGRALAEVRRVLRPGGALHFLEHGLAPERRVARWQHRLDPLQGLVCGGCQLSRDAPALVAGAGLDVVEVTAAYLPGPAVARPWSYGFVGRAVR
jgi:SAM-dependent methyltransferase